MISEGKLTPHELDCAPTRMGPLEFAVYKSDWMASRCYLRRVAELAAHRKSQAAAQATLERGPNAASLKAKHSPEVITYKPPSRGFPSVRVAASKTDDDEAPERNVDAPTPGRVAARLLLARMFDNEPHVMERLRASAPIVLVDVPDRAIFSRIMHQWRSALSFDTMRSGDISSMSDSARREYYDLLHVLTNEIIDEKNRNQADAKSFTALQLGLPIIAITPDALTHLSSALLDAATDRLVLPRLDGRLITRVIRVVTGKPCREELKKDLVPWIGVHELLVAVRFDRSPAECLALLRKLAESKLSKRGSRDIALDDLHGLDEAVEWARSTMVDVAAWKRGEIAWDAIDAGVVLDGPPGTGKTTFCKVVAAEMGLPLISATLAKWQSSGEAHLGHLLRAMRRDFDEARSKAPAIMFIDELDSFPDRGALTHNHKDYVIEVVNSFIEQLDGLQGRHGLIFIAATNDVRRCDPAIVRAGRLNRIINIGLPKLADIIKMMRVRLRGDLAQESLEEVALLAMGSTGADIEKFVKDGRRVARHAERALLIDDLRAAVLGTHEEIPDGLLARTAVHEAGHIVISVLHNGPSDIHAIVANGRESRGFVTSLAEIDTAGTADDCRRLIQISLAGRAAEELEFGSAGNGAGGVAGSDLAYATRVAAAMVGSFGHSGPHPLLYLADHRETENIIAYHHVRASVHQELSSAFDEAMRLLVKHRPVLKEVAQRLMKYRRIDGNEVHRILAGCR